MKAISLFALAGLLFFSACQSDTGDNATGEEAQVTEAAGAPSTILAISHAVEDYDVWREAYDAHAPARQEAGTLEAYVLQDQERENYVHVFAMFADSESAHAFVEDPAVATAMAEAGVVGEPQMVFMDLEELISADVNTGTVDRLLVSHPVADFGIWKVAFDEGQSARSEFGLTTLGVGRDEADPGLVHIMFAASDPDEARAFVTDPDLAEGMQAAGVTGPASFAYGTDVTSSAQ